MLKKDRGNEMREKKNDENQWQSEKNAVPYIKSSKVTSRRQGINCF